MRPFVPAFHGLFQTSVVLFIHCTLKVFVSQPFIFVGVVFGIVFRIGHTERPRLFHGRKLAIQSRSFGAVSAGRSRCTFRRGAAQKIRSAALSRRDARLANGQANIGSDRPFRLFLRLIVRPCRKAFGPCRDVPALVEGVRRSGTVQRPEPEERERGQHRPFAARYSKAMKPGQFEALWRVRQFSERRFLCFFQFRPCSQNHGDCQGGMMVVPFPPEYGWRSQSDRKRRLSLSPRHRPAGRQHRSAAAGGGGFNGPCNALFADCFFSTARDFFCNPAAHCPKPDATLRPITVFQL